MEEIDFTNCEDITLFTDEEQVKVNRVNEEFTQHSKLKGLAYHFTIFNHNHCYQHITRKHGGKQKFRVNLCYLDPKPIHRFKIAESWLIGSAILAIISLMLIYLNWFRASELDPSLGFTLTVLSTTLCLISFLFALLKSEDRMVFYSQYGRTPILELLNRNPDRKSFTQFLQSLSSHIVSAQAHAGLDKTQLLVQELKELRRLKDETVIHEAHYENAKKRIFRNKAFKS
jgi:hypothetical protein